MHKPRCLEDLVLYLVLKSALTLFAHLPQLIAVPVARSLGAVWFHLARRDARTAVAQLQTVLSLESRTAAVRMAKGVFSRIGEEVVALLHIVRDDERLTEHITIDGRANLDTALARGRGVVWLSGHVGNWELMAATVARMGYPLHAIVDPLHYPRTQGLLDDFRQRHGMHCLVRGRDTSRANLADHLARGHILGVLVDQRSNTWGAPLPFLGLPAHTPLVPVMVALQSGAPILVGIMERQGVQTYRIRILPPIRTDLENAPLFERACVIMTQVNEILGDAIRTDPMAWPWFHRRWGTTLGAR